MFLRHFGQEDILEFLCFFQTFHQGVYLSFFMFLRHFGQEDILEFVCFFQIFQPRGYLRIFMFFGDISARRISQNIYDFQTFKPRGYLRIFIWLTISGESLLHSFVTIKPANENIHLDGTEVAGTERTLLEHEKKPCRIIEYTILRTSERYSNTRVLVDIPIFYTFQPGGYLRCLCFFLYISVRRISQNFYVFQTIQLGGYLRFLCFLDNSARRISQIFMFFRQFSKEDILEFLCF